MISTVTLDTSPMSLGETRMLTVVAASPIGITIECFGSPPSPPVLQPCPECGEFTVRPGEALPVVATASALGGFLAILIRDGEGDIRQFRIPVRLDGGSGVGSPPGGVTNWVGNTMMERTNVAHS